MRKPFFVFGISLLVIFSVVFTSCSNKTKTTEKKTYKKVVTKYKKKIKKKKDKYILCNEAYQYTKVTKDIPITYKIKRLGECKNSK